jgi:prepilin-type N-terminal cleavage/methylation domain-containing protein
MKKLSKRTQGMTLIEILIVSAILSLLAYVISASLINGMKIWERSKRAMLEEDVIIFFEKIEHDLRNAYPYSKLSFLGTEKSFAFGIVFPEQAMESESAQTVGKVEYYFDITDKILYRRIAKYGQALKEEYAAGLAVMKGIDDLQFKYVYLTKEGEVSVPQTLDAFPAGIDIQIKFIDTEGEKKMQKLINIPMGW